MFAKSQSYCSTGAFGADSYGQKFAFLCEVSLGAVQDVRTRDLSDKPFVLNADRHSVKTSHTQHIPDPQSCVYWKGRTVPMGAPVRQQQSDASDVYNELNYNEYIVFNSQQTCLRYLIQFDD
ncbi:unnamed protein product [Oppiella nova]|uniref:Poly [ADP-ribose] polymerase n=1 Tax=Oppiella nova TaxID=334625 RepID=A0A7R9MCS5_9ACAR|nr:unnamed protein product [Oppiella nova]CAG2174585.1 unnamed protein product [Oppiella nova]